MAAGNEELRQAPALVRQLSFKLKCRATRAEMRSARPHVPSVAPRYSSNLANVHVSVLLKSKYVVEMRAALRAA